MHRCFLSMWSFRTSDRWKVNGPMCHDFWTGVAPLCSLCMCIANTCFFDQVYSHSLQTWFGLGARPSCFLYICLARRLSLEHENLNTSHYNNVFAKILVKIPCSLILCLLRQQNLSCVITQSKPKLLRTLQSWIFSIFMKPEATSSQPGEFTQLAEFSWRFLSSMLSELMHFKHLVLSARVITFEGKILYLPLCFCMHSKSIFLSACVITIQRRFLQLFVISIEVRSQSILFGTCVLDQSQ